MAYSAARTAGEDTLDLLAFDDEFDPLAVDDSIIDQEWMDDENPYDTIDYPTMRNMPETVHRDPVYSPARQGSATEALQALIVRNPNRRPVLLNVINVVRLVRLVKISRYMRGLRTIGRVIAKHYHEIVAAFLVIALLVVVSSVVMYEIEHPAQPDKFNNLLSGVYWAVTTITGTGYGDLVPITPAGRIVGSVIMFLSVALVAIPGGIFSAGFVAEFQNANLRKIERDVRREDARQDDRDEAQRMGARGPFGESGAASRDTDGKWGISDGDDKNDG